WNHPQLQGVSFDTQVSSGLKTAKAHGVPGDHILEKGQQILIDFGVNFQYYKSDITRTFFASHPCSQLEEMYKVVLEAQLTAIEKAAPGIPISQIDLAARNVIAKAGYGEYFNHRTGHGLGLDIHETPNIYDINEDILQEGMVFTVEPGIYLPQMGGVRVEDDVLITASGHHIFTDFPKEFSQIILEK
ncbi:MAG: M24 family metallopeptidase, partial [Clostridiales bacterium]